MATAMLGEGRTATVSDLFLLVEHVDGECVVSYWRLLSEAVAKARAFCAAGGVSAEVWLNVDLNVFACGAAEVGCCGDLPDCPVMPGRYRWNASAAAAGEGNEWTLVRSRRRR